MGKILIDFEAHEALLALGAIQDKQLTSSRLAAISEGEEHEIADLSAKVLHRVAQRLTDALYPTCSIEDGYGWRCDAPVDINGMCAAHDRMTA